MAKGSNQKLKLLYLMKILREQTDCNHSLSLKEIIDELGKYNISAERKSLYSDLEALRAYGLDIEMIRGRNTRYYVASRTFQLPELKLLVDAIEVSKFITHKKSNELIHKLESLSSRYDAQLLQRQVYVANRVKTANESIYYNVDAIHEALNTNHQISFIYSEWMIDFDRTDTIRKRQRKSGARYHVSPWALTWADENYYLVAYDATADCIKHFRVDKINSIDLEDEKRLGQELFQNFDMAIYSKSLFGMFGGQAEMVRLAVHNSLIGVIVDRFGKDVFLSPFDDEHFAVAVKVVVSDKFLSWVMSLGDKAWILGPSEAIDRFKKLAHLALSQYDD